MQHNILNTEVTTIDGEKTTLTPWAGKVLLIVNVASKCGLTPQYEQLEALQKDLESEGFSVLGFPCWLMPPRRLSPRKAAVFMSAWPAKEERRCTWMIFCGILKNSSSAAMVRSSAVSHRI